MATLNHEDKKKGKKKGKGGLSINKTVTLSISMNWKECVSVLM